ncbi:hypothetical protein AB0J83_49645, partial [Actinoplanes sp. NPDC049596]|uniref:hypothetical protein n=1 Tax=Actinoplanes sp. NPDC049596 TaxID=3154625 RepID=UPI00344A41FD
MGLTGWYIHHHGAGHLTRFRAVRPYLPGDVVAFSSMPEPDDLPPATTWVPLDRDDDRPPGAPDPATADPTAGGLLIIELIRHALMENVTLAASP